MVHPGRKAVAVLAWVLGTALRAAPWPAVDSDLAPDPAVWWGVLPNGLRYAVRPNAEPRGRVSLRLLVAAGSAEENPDEQGLAHFIEHMAFRGTRQHPGDAMTAELQRLGIGFGPDTAAFTFVDHTIYELELPDNREAAVRDGLEVLREYAEEITFDPRLIDRERDVILNERDTRDLPAARETYANLELLWPGSLQVRRKPIGLPEEIRAFQRRQFVAFYDAWYRPERMAVVVVGDVDPAAAVRLVAAALGRVAPRAPARPEVELVPPAASAPTVGLFVDAGIVGVHGTLQHPFPEPASPDTHARRMAQLRRSLALSILQRRAGRLTQGSVSGLVAPSAGVTNPVAGWSSVYFGGSGALSQWRSFLPDLEQQQRLAYDFGFTAAEVEVARAATAAALENAVNTAATWHSDWLATQLANSLIGGVVFSTPLARQLDLGAELAAATPASLLGEYRRSWGPGPLHVFVGAAPSLRARREDIAEVLNASRKKPVIRPAETAPVVFAYPDFGPPGSLQAATHVADLDLWEAAFPNGVRLNFKRTDFEANTVLVSVRVGAGRLSEPLHRPGLETLGSPLVNFGGLGRHSFEDLQEILSSHPINLSFYIDSDAFGFSARCPPKELGLCLRLITAYLTDAGFRAEAMPKARASIADVLISVATSPAGPIATESMRILAGGDDRFAGPTMAALNARTPDEVRAWIEPELRHGPIELGVVGDVAWDDVAAAVGATVGALPRREERTAATTGVVLGVPPRPAKPVYLATTDPSLRQVALAWLCPAPDVRDAHQERRCRLLAALVAERLRIRLRTDLGAAYGFDGDFVQTDGFPDLNFFAAATTVSPAHAQRANEIIRAELRLLEKGRFTDDEFERVRQPFLRAREKDLRDNTYWCYTVLRDPQLHPEHLAAARDRLSDCAAITRRDLQAAAARYFAYEHWFQFVAYPRRGGLEPPLTNPNGLPRGAAGLLLGPGSH